MSLDYLAPKTCKGISNDLCLIRTDASEKTGMGHFYRCLALSPSMEKYGFLPYFAVKYITDAIPSILNDRQIPYILIPEKTVWDEEVEIIIKNLQARPTTTILDMAHYHTFSDINGFSGYTKALRKISSVIALIDGFKTTALIDKVEMDIDMVITPYYCAEKFSPNKEKCFLHLVGHEYTIFSSEYARARNPKRKIADQAKKVLVT